MTTETFEAFEDIERERGDLKVVFEWLGEGLEGDYDPEDPADAPLLRFSVYTRVSDAKRAELGHLDGPWVAVEDASYCTQMPADTDRELLAFALDLMLDRLENAFDASYEPTYGLTRTCEDLSWLGPKEVIRARAEARDREWRNTPPAPQVGDIGERSRVSDLAE